jgi:hypothetical protein
MGFKAASSLFWPIPQGYLDSSIAAGVIALINSLGNLGGFVAPATFGIPGTKNRLDPGRPVRPDRDFDHRRDPGVHRTHHAQAGRGAGGQGRCDAQPFLML